jgi:hypothetical protein
VKNKETMEILKLDMIFSHTKNSLVPDAVSIESSSPIAIRIGIGPDAGQIRIDKLNGGPRDMGGPAEAGALTLSRRAGTAHPDSQEMVLRV